MDVFTLNDDGSWTCVIPLWFDPFGKFRATVSVDCDEDPSRELQSFLTEFGQRYREIWQASKDSLLSQGWSMEELSEAHLGTNVCIEDPEGPPPEVWCIEYDLEFSNRCTIGYTLDFAGWSTDNQWGGCH